MTTVTIFIPVLFICINSNCEFMQSTDYFWSEQQCLASLDRQKQRMKNLVKQADQGKIEILEGTCVDLDVQIIKSQSTMFTKGMKNE